VKLNAISEQEEPVRIKIQKMRDRVYIGRSLGFHVEGAAPLGPSIKDQKNAILGIQHRIKRATPKLSNKMLREFRTVVRMFCKRHFVPLEADVDLSIETWLAGSNYNERRKEQLRNCYERDLKNSDFRNKRHTKCEFYPEPKHARSILSRMDRYKCEVGPLFKQIEEEIYKHPAFIKTVPTLDRPRYMFDMMHRPGCKYMATDHTSFEAHIKSEIMKVCEINLYSYMCKNIDRKYISHIRRALLEKQSCFQEDLEFNCDARMSGDMNTSLGNGFTNLMIMEYLRIKKGWSELVGVVEGDDGLFLVSGQEMTVDDFDSIGFCIKQTIHESVGEAGFCKLYNDGETFDNLLDPKSALLACGWSRSRSIVGGKKKLIQLAKSKAYSLLAEGPSNPITRSMALWVLRCTESVRFPKISSTDSPWHVRHHYVKMSELMLRTKPPTLSQRSFFEDKFGISPELQLQVEEYFDSLDTIGPITNQLVKHIVYDRHNCFCWDSLVFFE